VAPAHNTRVWWCIDCGAWFCDPCWPLQISHGKGRTNRDGMPHERTDPRLQQALQDVLHPSLGSLPEDELDRLHEADEETTWFGMMSLAANSRRPVLTYISRNWKGKARSPISDRWWNIPIFDGAQLYPGCDQIPTDRLLCWRDK
jgi:hypothetical protein